ncbi:hypothetical protein HanOQP8_Chr16g0603351 [Helianthus annuus]|nr:hypothetical protein HanOQP8_Chr16g0603351 [Helianthus annuus]
MAGVNDGGGGGGGGGGVVKVVEPVLVAHPVKDQLQNVSYCITSPPPWRKFFLSFFCNIYLIFFQVFLMINTVKSGLRYTQIFSCVLHIEFRYK